MKVTRLCYRNQTGSQTMKGSVSFLPLIGVALCSGGCDRVMIMIAPVNSPLHPCIHTSTCSPIHSSIHASTHASMHQSIDAASQPASHPPIYSSIHHLFMCLSIHLSMCPSTYASIHPSSRPSIHPHNHTIIY